MARVTQNRTLVSGANGFVGSALMNHLQERSRPASRLVRTPSPGSTPSFLWNPRDGKIDLNCLERVDQVIHLAGENIADGRWTTAKKARILQSRIESTQLLCDSMAHLSMPPKVLVSASAVGFYGNRGTEVLTEESPAGQGFLAEVCQAWEEHTEPARQAGIRCVQLRIGLVLSPIGGALAKMIPPFRLGLGGRIGSGQQYVSWITLDDLLAVIDYCLANQSLSGPINAVAPNAVTNLEFTHALGKALRRPTLLPFPRAMAQLIFGEMAEATLLASTRAQPAKLTAGGFRFTSPDLASALQGPLRIGVKG
jgi:uncharacterized protein (TIGR01777 family)